MKVRLIANRGGGSFTEDQAAKIEELLAGQGVTVELRLAEPGEVAEAFAEAAEAEGLDAVVAAGGDGTISAAAAALAGTGRPLGVVPLGTLNHFARDCGIPTDPAGATAAIAGGRTRDVDVAEVNGQVFINNSAVGLYPLMVRHREAQQKRLGRSKRLAMVVASVRALRHFSKRRLIIRVAGRKAPIETPLLFVGNNHYDTQLLALGRRQSVDQGELCLYAPLARARFHFLRLAARSLFGRLDQVRDFVNLDGLTEIEVDSTSSSLIVSVDGETRTIETPLVYRTRPGALRLLVPAEEEVRPDRS